MIWPHSDCSRSEILLTRKKMKKKKVIGEVAKDVVEHCNFLF